MRIFFTLVVFLVSCVAMSAAVSASKEPRPIKVDHRVRTVSYQPDEVYKFTGHYRYQSSIEFELGEEIQTISMGDSTAWMLNPSGHRLFLKPIAQDATTNMTIITNRRTYLLELHARETDDITDKNMVFIMRFIYPESAQSQMISQQLDGVPSPDIPENAEKLNFNYTISGSEQYAPLRIFDDGEFTYFQFKNKNADLPAFYWVDDEGNEAVINYRTRGDYIVVERVSKRMSLRHGNQVVCVFNEALLSRMSRPQNAQ